MEVCDFLSPSEFDKLFFKARLIVSHAGMGTVITALTHNKPVIIMPRIARLGEHRNEHQLATAAMLKEMGYVYVVDNEINLVNVLMELLQRDEIKPLHRIGKYASDSLIKSISDFLKSK